MRLTQMSARTAAGYAELLVEFDGVHNEAIRMRIGAAPAEIAGHLRALASRIERRPKSSVCALGYDTICSSCKPQGVCREHAKGTTK